MRIALVGKYVQLHDATGGRRGAQARRDPPRGPSLGIDWIDAEDRPPGGGLAGSDGILVPGGFGGAASRARSRRARLARERGIPFLGICLGMQIAVIEFARHVCGMEGANSSETRSRDPVPGRDRLPEQRVIEERGGMMRWAHPVLSSRARARRPTATSVVYERHLTATRSTRPMPEAARQAPAWSSAGARRTSGWSRSIELPGHCLRLAVHPEFKRWPTRP